MTAPQPHPKPWKNRKTQDEVREYLTAPQPLDVDEIIEDHFYSYVAENGLNQEETLQILEDAKKDLRHWATQQRIDTAKHLHRNQGRDLPKRDFDNDTDEYICDDYIPSLEATLKGAPDKK